MTIQFDTDREDVEVRLAKFIAELVRQGVCFKVTETNRYYEVEMTGGY